MVYIKEKNWDRILGYAEEAYDTLKTEIGGMSVCIQDKDGDWEIQHPVILKQEVTSGNCTLEQDELAKYYTRTAKQLKGQVFRFCWWHSHHTMKAFWSSTDLQAIEEFNDGDFSFALVVNLKGEYKLRISVWNPIETHEDVELEIIRPPRATKKVVNDVKEMCSKPVLFPAHQVWDPALRKYKTNTSKANKSLTSYKDATFLPYYKLRASIDEISSKVCDGSYSYKQYKESIEDIKGALNLHKSLYDISLFTEAEVKSGILLHLQPDDMILDKQTKLPFYEDELSMHGYSYNGWPQ